jgi:GxxExxY protein
MNADSPVDDRRFDWITEKVIACAYRVHNKLGMGFAEKCYRKAMMIELRKDGLRAAEEVELKVWYEDEVVGEYFADIIVEGVVVVELKAVKAIENAHLAQCLNYLAATKLPICLLLNFARSVQVRRVAGPMLSVSVDRQ